MSRTAGSRNKNCHYGPIPATKYDDCVSCVYLGTNYCMDYCPDAEEILQSCDYKCRHCTHQPQCPCSTGHLPRLIALHLDLSTLPPPAPSTIFLPKRQVCSVSSRYPTSTWLLCNPRQHARDIIAEFLSTYNYLPSYYLYARNLGVLICGPIQTNGCNMN